MKSSRRKAKRTHGERSNCQKFILSRWRREQEPNYEPLTTEASTKQHVADHAPSWTELDSDGLRTPTDSDASEDLTLRGGELEKVLAMDCEMVSVGARKSAVARCSVVDYYGRVVFDEYIKPDDVITDYRTFVSGIRPRHMRCSITYQAARKRLERLLKGAILVGHSLHNDLNCLNLRHPVERVRDIAKFPALHLHAGFFRLPSLKNLTQLYLQRHIQEGEHCSIEDATAAMDLYRLVRNEWECGISITNSSALLEDEYWPDDMNQFNEIN
ncbi:RNA exonuclease 4-like [Corticium candelabrum]|uniref:RNA exonuclease 4-like n=1 Tax=Corticium candelabrum TaxID=121492 RepID=UPI002E25285E|nr:RNA exonuclease 4-like [Corticium candelabrum]